MGGAGSISEAGEQVTSIDVIIIGAGLSGLKAATDLQAAGLTTLNLEAKGRVGGKTYSVSNGRKGTVDVDAAWINDTTQRRMYALSQKFGIDVVVQRSTGLDIQQQEDGSVDLLPFGEVKVSSSFNISGFYCSPFSAFFFLHCKVCPSSSSEFSIRKYW
jgi:pyruvate/2-oxoglutarate dehydrogenase complex dihydrolipoamide dehydrogenase (E3) component